MSGLPLIDGGQARCKVELTEIHTGGHAWWTLGFEATGPARLLPGKLRATAALVFAQALPGGVVPGTDNSASYAEWLHRKPATARESRLPADRPCDLQPGSSRGRVRPPHLNVSQAGL